MTHQLDLTAELEAKLQALAEQRGQDVSTTTLQVLAEALSDVEAPAPVAAKAPRVLRGYGKFAGRGGTVDDLLREKHEETRREMEREDARLREAQRSEAGA